MDSETRHRTSVAPLALPSLCLVIPLSARSSSSVIATPKRRRSRAAAPRYLPPSDYSDTKGIEQPQVAEAGVERIGPTPEQAACTSSIRLPAAIRPVRSAHLRERAFFLWAKVTDNRSTCRSTTFGSCSTNPLVPGPGLTCPPPHRSHRRRARQSVFWRTQRRMRAVVPHLAPSDSSTLY